MSAASVLLDSPALESLRTVPGAGSSANKSQQLHTQVRDAFLGIGNLSTMQEGDDGKNLESMTAKLAQVHTLVARKVAKEPRRWVSSKWKGDVATQAAELHPILLTLLLAVVDIYTHRSHQNSYFERARAMIRAKCTTGIAGIALEFRTAFQKSMESASRNLMRRVETEFLKQHAEDWERIRAAMKRAHGRPARKNATLDQFLEDAAAAAEAEKGNGMRMYGHAAAASATKAKAKANVTYPSSLMGGIVETLPWKRLQQRLALWKMQLQQCRRVLQLQSGVGSDGVALSRALAEGQRKLTQTMLTRAKCFWQIGADLRPMHYLKSLHRSRIVHKRRTALTVPAAMLMGMHTRPFKTLEMMSEKMKMACPSSQNCPQNCTSSAHRLARPLIACASD